MDYYGGDIEDDVEPIGGDCDECTFLDPLKHKLFNIIIQI